MSLITRCPVCGTMFKVVPDQLRISEGWVRCGNCTEVFDATAYLQTNAVLPSAAEPDVKKAPTSVPPNVAKSSASAAPLKTTPKLADPPVKTTFKTASTQPKADLPKANVVPPITKHKNSLAPVSRPLKSGTSPELKDGQEDEKETRSWRRLVLNPRSWAAMDAVNERQMPFTQLSGERIKPTPSSLQLPDLESLFEPETGFDFDASLEQSIVATESEWHQIQSSQGGQSQQSGGVKTSKKQLKLASMDAKAIAKEGLHLVHYADSDITANKKAQPEESAVAAPPHPFLAQKEPASAPSAYAQLHPVASVSTLAAVPGGGALTALDLALERDAIEREERKAKANLVVELSLVDNETEAPPTSSSVKQNALNAEVLLQVPNEWQLELAPSHEVRDMPKARDPLPVVSTEIKRKDEGVAVDDANFETALTAKRASELEDYPDLDNFSFVRVAQRKAFWRRPSVVVAQILVCISLLFLLGFQVLVLQRDYFAESMPITRPLIDVACGAMKCEISPYKEIESMAIDASSFNKIQGNLYKFDVIVKNTGHLTLAMPALELTLLDVLQRPLIRRVLLPPELDAPEVLSAQNKWEGSISVELSTDIQVSGYRLLAFYP